MKESLPPHDPVDTVGKAYEFLLEKAQEKAHQSAAVVHHVMDEIRDDMGALNKLSDVEIDKLTSFVERDLVDAAQYLDKTGKELKEWLGFDVDYIKHEFWERFSKAADQTTTALVLLKLKAENAEYHTGEITGLGTLVCDQCGEKLHFHQPGHIPPCPKCNGTHFHRLHAES
ncbi:MAG: zinc ribbon-containing protein [Betaproteobacteria bacterium]|nr:zinc ribbon-containing protein [Betaproteobacteria bacterium]